MDPITLGLIFISAIFIGIFAVVMGGTLFLSLPLFQILFPDMALGVIIGTIKFGSIFRNSAALIPIYKKLDKRALLLAPLLCFGSVLGSWEVASVSQAVVPIVLIVGLIIHEYGQRIKLQKHIFWIVTFAVGIYGGILGAGIMLLIMSLLRFQQDKAVDSRANALLLEMLLGLVAVLTFWHLHLINWPLSLTWAGGGMIGGIIGGVVIERTGKWPQATQDWLIRVAFLLALGVSLYKIF